MVMHLDEENVRAVLHWDTLIAAMETALAAFSRGHVRPAARTEHAHDRGGQALSRHHAGGLGGRHGPEAGQLLSGQRRHRRTHAHGDGAAVPAGHRGTARRHGRPPDYRDADGRRLGSGDQALGVTGQPRPCPARQRRPGQGPSRGARAGPRLRGGAGLEPDARAREALCRGLRCSGDGR
jgi:hypothetical protein